MDARESRPSANLESSWAAISGPSSTLIGTRENGMGVGCWTEAGPLVAAAKGTTAAARVGSTDEGGEGEGRPTERLIGEEEGDEEEEGSPTVRLLGEG